MTTRSASSGDAVFPRWRSANLSPSWYIRGMRPRICNHAAALFSPSHVATAPLQFGVGSVVFALAEIDAAHSNRTSFELRSA